MIAFEYGPGGAARQPQYRSLAVKRSKSCGDKNLAQLPDLRTLTCLKSYTG